MSENENVLQSAFQRYLDTVEEICQTKDWSAFADMFAEDATYCEHVYGDFKGRGEIRAWIVKTMVDEVPGNEMSDPGDGSVHEESNITILTFDDAGNLIREEDIYNPAKFATMTREWCRVAEAHGTLSDAGKRLFAALGG